MRGLIAQAISRNQQTLVVTGFRYRDDVPSEVSMVGTNGNSRLELAISSEQGRLAFGKALTEEVRSLVQNGAHIYVCGSDEFSAQVLSLFGGDKTCRLLRYAGRLHVESHTSAAPTDLETLRPISWSELSKHNKMNDCWVSIGGIVYDVIRYLKSRKHPGGEQIIFQFAGRDATELFDSVGVHLPYRQKCSGDV